VPGRVQHLDVHAGQAQLLPFLEIIRRLGALSLIPGQAAKAVVAVFQHDAVHLVDVDGRFREGAQGAGVVKMPVGEEHGGHPPAAQRGLDAAAFGARVNDQRVLAVFLIHDIAVGRQLVDRQSEYLHGHS